MYTNCINSCTYKWCKQISRTQIDRIHRASITRSSPYLPPFLWTHPFLSDNNRQEQHNIFPIRWLDVLKATIKLRSSNLRSRQMDAGFSGRWPSSSSNPLPKPLSLLVFSPSSLESLLSPTEASKTREFGDPECND